MSKSKKKSENDMNTLLSYSISTLKSESIDQFNRKNFGGNNTVSQIINSESIMKVFVNDKEKLDEKNECGWTPLYRTIIGGNNTATEHLLGIGADPNVKSNVSLNKYFILF